MFKLVCYNFGISYFIEFQGYQIIFVLVSVYDLSLGVCIIYFELWSVIMWRVV